MSTEHELVRFDESEYGVLATSAGLTPNSEEVASILEDVGLRALLPTIGMKGGKPGQPGSFSMTSGGTESHAGSKLNMVVLAIGVGRAIFDPDEQSKRKLPVCSSPQRLHKESGFGVWDMDSGFVPDDGAGGAGQRKISCDECKWSRFGSAAKWRGLPQEKGRGPACGQRWTLYCIPMATNGALVDRLREGGAPQKVIDSIDPTEMAWMDSPTRLRTPANTMGIVQLDLNGTSAKAIDAIKLAATATPDVSVSGNVFEFTVKTSEDNRGYAICEVKRVGVTPRSVRTIMKVEAEKMISRELKSRIDRDSVLPPPSYTVDVGNGGEKDGEIPF
jgi:hypothetical protein